MRKHLWQLLVLALLAALLLGISAAQADSTFYVISFDSNGADYNIDPLTKYPGQAATIPNSCPTRRGYNFLGWGTSASGKAVYQPGDSYTKDGDATLYAIWQTCPDLGCITSKTATIPSTTLKRFGYVSFTVATDDWYMIRSTNTFYENTSGTVRVEWENYNSEYLDYNYGEDFSGLVELVAGTRYYLFYYMAKEELELQITNTGFYKVQFDGNGVNYRIDPMIKYPGVTAALPNSSPTRMGYNFAGWATSPTGKAVYQPGGVFTKDQDMTLYAVWQPCPDLGTISAGSYTVASSALKRFGYLAFQVAKDGYYRIASTNTFYESTSGTTRLEWSGYNSSYLDYEYGGEFEGTVELKAGTQYYLFYYMAKDVLELDIKQDGYIITFDSNGANVSIDPLTKKPGVALTLPTSCPTRRGYNFGGWATSATGSAVYQPGDRLTKDQNMTLYAVWKACPDLGTVAYRGMYTVPSSALKRFGYVTFVPKRTGNYVIRSTNTFYENSSGTVRVEWGNYNSEYLDYNYGEDFSGLVELEAGTQYYLFYYMVKEELELEILYQFTGLDITADGVIPYRTVTIEAQAFAGTDFSVVEIPETVTVIGSKAFANCKDLTTVIFFTDNATIAADAFSGCGSLTVYAPAGSTAQTLAENNGWNFIELK